MSFISWLPSTYLFQTCIYTDLLAENISIRDKNFILWRSSLSQYLQKNAGGFTLLLPLHSDNQS